jgi:hypothetical protein
MALSLMLVATKPAQAASSTFTVNRTTNESDANTADGVCDVDTATDGNQCTLKAAIQQANANANPTETDTINFKIPGRGVKTIKPASELPQIREPVTIDGYTQPKSKKNTRATGATDAVLKIQLDGSLAGSNAGGLVIQGSSNVTIRGLVINRFEGAGVRVTTADGSDNNHIEGNLIGTNASGNSITDASDPTKKLGNRFGVDIGGLNDGNVVGGTTPETRNIISGNRTVGVFAGTSGTDTIQGNLIGTDRSATKELGNVAGGIEVGGQNSVIRDNIIAFNASDGVRVKSNATGTGHDIGPNSIFSNDGLGIDLVDTANNGFGPNCDGPNTNDGGTADDAETGPNNLQNSPTIPSATTSSSTKETTIDARLDSVPSTTFTIRFYSNPRDTGEGKTFIGQIQVTTGADGTVSINDFKPAKAVPVGQSITATATDSAGNTSEFTGEPRSVKSAP